MESSNQNRGSVVAVKANHCLHLMCAYNRFILALTLVQGAKCNDEKSFWPRQNNKRATYVLLCWFINKQVISNTDALALEKICGGWPSRQIPCGACLPTLSPTNPLNPRGILPRGMPFSRNSSSEQSKPSSHCAPYFSMKYLVLLAEHFVRLNSIYLCFVTFSLVPRGGHHITYASRRTRTYSSSIKSIPVYDK